MVRTYIPVFVQVVVIVSKQHPYIIAIMLMKRVDVVESRFATLRPSPTRTHVGA